MSASGHEVWLRWRKDHWLLTCSVCSWRETTLDDKMATLFAEAHGRFS